MSLKGAPGSRRAKWVGCWAVHPGVHSTVPILALLHVGKGVTQHPAGQITRHCGLCCHMAPLHGAQAPL